MRKDIMSKNLGAISKEEQVILGKKKLVIAGVGALGQMVAMSLARTGFRQFILMDPDSFEYSNFNRQLYANEETIGKSKVEETKRQLLKISPDTSVTIYRERLCAENGREKIWDADILIDCVDKVADKLCLEELAEKERIPLVHAAVNGWFGQVSTVFPGDKTLSKIYQDKEIVSESNLAVTVGFIGALQAGEVIKTALNQEAVLRKKVLFADILHHEYKFLDIT